MELLDVPIYQLAGFVGRRTAKQLLTALGVLFILAGLVRRHPAWRPVISVAGRSPIESHRKRRRFP